MIKEQNNIMQDLQNLAQNSSLGKDVNYSGNYDPKLLFAIEREPKRQEISLVPEQYNMHGVDIWNAYEISWLNSKGKPQVAVATISFPHYSKSIIESKSLKLYLGSFNETKFEGIDIVASTIKSDLRQALECRDINVKLEQLPTADFIASNELEGKNIDELDVECTDYSSASPNVLLASEKVTEEVLTSNLLKSNCLITNQPDWATLQISYKGKQINRESLLKYIVSFRLHNEFHEQCVERIYKDLYDLLKPERLTVYARYTRRGGIDICPFRTNIKDYKAPANIRLIRQ